MKLSRGRRGLAFVATAIGALVAVASPAFGVDSADVTGDVTAPTLVSFSVTPSSVDVTDAPANVTLRAHVTDDLSGVKEPTFGYMPPGPGQSAYGTSWTKVSGDDKDSTWQAVFGIPRGARPGQYELSGTIADRVGNGRAWSTGDLARDGFPGSFAVADADPDETAPNMVDVTVTPSAVDVRTNTATINVDVRATDDKSGVYGMYVFVLTDDGSSAGVRPPPMTLTSGDAFDGHWTGSTTIPRYTRNGRFGLNVGVMDRLINIRDYPRAQLIESGYHSTVDVTSEEDRDAPVVKSFALDRVEFNVHDADQQFTVRMRVTDNLSGVRQDLDLNQHAVFADFRDDVHHQSTGVGGFARTAGSALDGIYETTVSIPKSSATGVRVAYAATADAVANEAWTSPDQIAAMGGPPAILIYNTPLPPVLLNATPDDTSALVTWDPPVDDRGAPVTDYIVHELPQGLTTHVDGDSLEASVAGLTNGVRHEFTVEAINKAGPSDPSNMLAAVPRAAPAAAPAPAPAPAPQTAPQPGAVVGSGYWMLGANSDVFAFGEAAWAGNPQRSSNGVSAIDIEPTPTRDGYWVVDSRGTVASFGTARPAVPRRLAALEVGEEVTSMSATPSGNGYWLFTNRGRVMPHGDAPFLGDMAGTRLNGPVLDSVATPSGNGYYMVAADGGVFTFGDARFAGSMGGKPLNAPVRSLVPDSDGLGYWLVASDGGIFTFDAPFFGSMGATRLNKPITGMVASRTGGGYLMVGEDGGIFTFGDVPFRGSLGASPPPTRVTAVAAF